jgi:hypothetical protein
VGGVEVYLRSLLTSALEMEVCGELDIPAALPPGRYPRYPLDRRLGEFRTGLNDIKFIADKYLLLII